MTQIICASYNNRQGLVFVSDRMISVADGSLNFEYEPKGQMLSYNAMTLVTGTMHIPEIINDAQEEISERTGIRDMVDILSKHYVLKRKRKVEIAVLSTHGFPSFDEYHQKQKLLADQTMASIEQNLDEYEIGLDILFGGVDNNGAQIYLITDPGLPISYTDVGFCCKGSGERHTDPVFAFYRYAPSLPLEEVLYISYAAKKRAEMAGAVGKATDIWIIDIGGCRKVNVATIARLDDCLSKSELVGLHGKIDIEYDGDAENHKDE